MLPFFPFQPEGLLASLDNVHQTLQGYVLAMCEFCCLDRDIENVLAFEIAPAV